MKKKGRGVLGLNITAAISRDIHELTFSWPVTVTISEKVSPGYTER